MDNRTILLVGVSAGAALILNTIITPIVLRIAHAKQWYDEWDHRKIHTGDMPRLGGVGVFLSFSLALVVAAILVVAWWHALSPAQLLRLLPIPIGLAITHTVGLIDDFRNIRAATKIIGQIAGAILLVAASALIRGVHVPVFGWRVPLGPLDGAFTILWIISVSNAINLVDGMDGMAGGISAIAAVAFGVMHLLTGNVAGAIVAAALFGAIVGFLLFNFPPAKLFMGDSGALFLGAALAIVPFIPPVLSTSPVVTGLPTTDSWLFPAITVLLLPILDMIMAILRRVRLKKPIHEPDRNHIHHKLLDLGYRPRRILLTIIYPAAIFAGAAAIGWMLLPHPWGDIVMVASWAVSLGAFWLLHIRNRQREQDVGGPAQAQSVP